MPSFYVDSKGNYHYAPQGTFQSNRQSPKELIVKKYISSLRAPRSLTNFPISRLLQRSDRGFFDVSSLQDLSSEQNVFGSSIFHEKSWPGRVGVESDKGIIPCYFKPYDMQSDGIMGATQKIASNVIFSKLFPTKNNQYIAYRDGSFGVLNLDFNNLKGVKSLRLDKYLQAKGVELNSIVSFMQAYKNGVFKEDLTDTCIAQIMFGMLTLPNAIDELDPNTRNAILLGEDRKGARYDSVVRIDLERNVESESSSNIIRVYPVGIYGRDEESSLFKENLAKALVDKEITVEDANIIKSMNEVAESMMKKEEIDHAVAISAIDHGNAESGAFTKDKLLQCVEETPQSAQKYSKDFGTVVEESKVESSIKFDPPELNKDWFLLHCFLMI